MSTTLADQTVSLVVSGTQAVVEATTLLDDARVVLIEQWNVTRREIELDVFKKLLKLYVDIDMCSSPPNSFDAEFWIAKCLYWHRSEAWCYSELQKDIESAIATLEHMDRCTTLFQQQVMNIALEVCELRRNALQNLGHLVMRSTFELNTLSLSLGQRLEAQQQQLLSAEQTCLKTRDSIAHRRGSLSKWLPVAAVTGILLVPIIIGYTIFTNVIINEHIQAEKLLDKATAEIASIQQESTQVEVMKENLADLSNMCEEIENLVHTLETQLGGDKVSASTQLLEARKLSVECQMLQFQDSANTLLTLLGNLASLVLLHHNSRAKYLHDPRLNHLEPCLQHCLRRRQRQFQTFRDTCIDTNDPNLNHMGNLKLDEARKINILQILSVLHGWKFKFVASTTLSGLVISQFRLSLGLYLLFLGLLSPLIGDIFVTYVDLASSMVRMVWRSLQTIRRSILGFAICCLRLVYPLIKWTRIWIKWMYKRCICCRPWLFDVLGLMICLSAFLAFGVFAVLYRLSRNLFVKPASRNRG